MSNSFTQWAFPGKHPFCTVKQRFERALSHNSGCIYRAAWCGSVFYMVVTRMCVWERACAFSQGLIDQLPGYPVLYDDDIFIWLFVLLCACIWTVKALLRDLWWCWSSLYWLMSLLAILIELLLTWGRETLGFTSAGLETFIQKQSCIQPTSSEKSKTKKTEQSKIW